MKQFKLLLLITALIFVGCGGKSAKTESSATNETTDSVVTPSVYIVGYETENDISKAVYWKDGVKTVLNSEYLSTIAYSIAVDGNDIYVAGYEKKDADYEISTICFWKNGKRTNLVKDLEWSYANNIKISGKDIYIAGSIENNACYWKNGKVVMLSNLPKKQPDEEEEDLGEFIFGRAIAISGNDVYVVGCHIWGCDGMPCYWKNGKINYLKKNTQGNAMSVMISGNDVYIAGFIDNIACYWKNGELVNITDETQKAYCIDIFVFGSDVYVIGSETIGFFDSNPTYKSRIWKNKVIMPLESSDNSQFSVLFVSGNDEYVAGTESSENLHKVCLWKNGKKTIIEESKNSYSITSIMVK